MSTAIAKNFQIGADSTPSNNFTLYQPTSPDGTLRLGNGNTGITSSLLTLTSAGNLGIGTSSPSGKLEVVGAIRSILNSGQGGQSLIGAISGVSNGYEVNVTTGNVQTYRWHNGGTVSMELDSSGNFRFNSGYGSVATAFGCRAWVNFNGTGTVAIRASGNVSSITDNGTGNYRVNFTTAMPDANYCVNVTIGSTSTDSSWTSIYIPNTSNGGAPTTTSCGVNTGFVSGSNQGDLDPVRVNVAIFR